MAPGTPPQVLDVAGRLLDDHQPTPRLPPDVAVHAAALLAGEHPRYTEVSRSGRRRLVFTLVTPTRVLKLSVPARRPPAADGADVTADVWHLDALAGLRLLPPRPTRAVGGPARAAADPAAGADARAARPRWDGCRWLLAFSGAPPVRLPVGTRPTAGQRCAATRVARDLLTRSRRPAPTSG